MHTRASWEGKWTIEEGTAPGKKGDVNNDGVVNINDVTALIDAVLGNNWDGLNYDNADCNLDEGVNINDVENTTFSVYPNPATDFVQVATDQIERVEIYNMMGQKVFEQFYGDSHAVISTNGFAPGTYFVVVTTHGDRVTKQVIVK